VNTQPIGLPTSAAQTTLSRIMTTLDTNLLGTVHGGVIMKLALRNQAWVGRRLGVPRGGDRVRGRGLQDQ
jgi:hypothetical protein